MQASGLTEFIPFICISAVWGQILFPCSPLLLTFLLSNCREGQQHPLDLSFGTLIHIWRHAVMMAVTFLVYFMAGVTPSVVIIFRGSVFILLFPNTHGPLEKFAHAHHSCQVKGNGKESTCQHTRGSHCSSLQGTGCL